MKMDNSESKGEGVKIVHSLSNSKKKKGSGMKNAKQKKPSASPLIGFADDSTAGGSSPGGSVVSALSGQGSQKRKGFKQSFVGSTDSSVPGLVESQGNALMDAIRDLEKNERVRIKWMDAARDDRRREALEERYTKERERDKQKLDNLITDFKVRMRPPLSVCSVLLSLSLSLSQFVRPNPLPHVFFPCHLPHQKKTGHQEAR